ITWHFSGMNGDDAQVAERIEKAQLDGVASTGLLCERLSPSMRVLGMPGLFGDPAELRYVTRQLQPLVTAEMTRAGFTLLATSGLGPAIIFSRAPIRTMAQLRATRLWERDVNE